MSLCHHLGWWPHQDGDDHMTWPPSLLVTSLRCWPPCHFTAISINEPHGMNQNGGTCQASWYQWALSGSLTSRISCAMSIQSRVPIPFPRCFLYFLIFPGIKEMGPQHRTYCRTIKSMYFHIRLKRKYQTFMMVFFVVDDDICFNYDTLFYIIYLMASRKDLRIFPATWLQH